MDWRNLFVGRDDVLSELLTAYKLAANGEPQCRVLLAETGWGKTRIVQEFYARLAAAHDPTGYWPSSIFAEETEVRHARRQAVNPDFAGHHGSPDIPYLWWGIRAIEGSRIAIQDAQRHLLPHLAPLTYPALDAEGRAKLRAAGVEVGLHYAEQTYEVLKELFEALAPGAKYVSAAVSIYRLLLAGREAHDGHHATERTERLRQETPGERFARDEAELPEYLATQLAALLDRQDRRMPSVPLVLVLDDAHWLDATSVELVARLWRDANDRRWPLIVIAAHWQDRWPGSPMGIFHADPAHQSVGLAPQLPVRTNPDLGVVVAAAFPRMSADQQKELLSVSRGHALHLRELILHVTRNSLWFEGGDVGGNLTPHGLHVVRTSGNRNELSRRRFEELGEEIRQILGWGSLQGQQFLHRLTARLAACEEFAPRLEREAHDARISEARNRAFVAPLPHADGSEFDQVDFRHLAQAAFREQSDAYQAAVVAALRTSLVEGLLDHGFSGIPFAERNDLTAIAVSELNADPSDSRVEEALAVSWLDRTRGLIADRLWRDARKAAAKLAALSPAAVSAALGRGSNPVGLFYALFSLRALPEAFAVAASMEAVAERGSRAAGLWADCGAQAAIEFRDWRVADRLAARSLEMRRRIVADFGADAQSLRDVSVSLDNVGRVREAARDWPAASAAYEESLEVCRRIVADFGTDAQSLRDVSVSLNNVGRVREAARDWPAASAAYEESLEVRRRIVADFGADAQSLRDVSVSLINLSRAAAGSGGDRRPFLSEAIANHERLCRAFHLDEQFRGELEEFRKMLAASDLQP